MFDGCGDEGDCETGEYTGYGVAEGREFMVSVLNGGLGSEEGLRGVGEDIFLEDAAVKG